MKVNKKIAKNDDGELYVVIEEKGKETRFEMVEDPYYEYSAKLIKLRAIKDGIFGLFDIQTSEGKIKNVFVSINQYVEDINDSARLFFKKKIPNENTINCKIITQQNLEHIKKLNDKNPNYVSTQIVGDVKINGEKVTDTLIKNNLAKKYESA